MNDAPNSGNELKEIQEKLTDIEKKLGDKWVIPVVVAIIAGVFGLVNIFVQISMQNKTQEEIVRRIKEEETLGMANGTERANFHLKALDLIEKINTGFEKVCLFTPDKKTKFNDKAAKIDDKDSLISSLEQYLKMLETAPTSIDEDTKKKLEAYSEFVAESQFQIGFSKTSPDKKELLNKSRELKKEAVEALNKSRQKSSFA